MFKDHAGKFLTWCILRSFWLENIASDGTNLITLILQCSEEPVFVSRSDIHATCVIQQLPSHFSFLLALSSMSKSDGKKRALEDDGDATATDGETSSGKVSQLKKKKTNKINGIFFIYLFYRYLIIITDLVVQFS